MTGSSRLAGAWASWRAADPASVVHSLIPRTWRPLLATGVGLGVIIALQAGGSVAGMSAALQIMGFDPDRATLISSLTVAGLTAGLGALVSGRRGVPMALGFVALADIFGTTFLAETSAALAVHGAAGFSLGGWGATLVTLVVVGLVTGWSMVSLAIEVRRWLLAGWDLTRDTLAGGTRDGHPLTRRRLVRTLVPIAIVALVVGALPTFADMINYTPDVAMTGGGFAQAPPLVGGGGSSTAAGTGPAGVGAQAASVPSTPPATVAPGAVAAARPWASHPPSGQGRVVQFKLPAPWTGGRVTRTSVWLYLPPGYDSGAQRYPVIYAVPWAFTNWDLGIHIRALLDQAITQGTIPPSIVAFIDLGGGPYPNSECADSFNGQEHADTYVSSTVIGYVDSHYRTIADANARTIAGFSQGGFCAANLLLRHPTVFHQAVIFAGYFVAGLASGQTVNAWQPWGHVASLIAANSPMTTASSLAPSVRRQLFVVMAAQPNVGVFGQQASAFAGVLSRDGYPTDFLWNAYGHAWIGVRTEFLPALQAVAAREVRTGVLP
jgi:enterochelin esterase-like enzyme